MQAEIIKITDTHRIVVEIFLSMWYIYCTTERSDNMEDMVISVNTLPDTLHRRFRSSRVRVNEADGIVTLTPVGDIESDARVDNSNIQALKTNSQIQLEAFDTFISAMQSASDVSLTDDDFSELESNRANFENINNFVN